MAPLSVWGEPTVSFVPNNFFAGEDFIDRDDAQRRAVPDHCGDEGARNARLPPVEMFNVEGKPRLLLAPMSRYDLPICANAKIHRDHQIEVA